MKKVKLTEICNPKQWKTLSTNELKDDGKYLVYGANGIIGSYNTYNHEKETVLITCRGATCGNIHISKEKSYINGNAMALDDLNEKICLKRYLYYFLKQYDMKKIISGSAQPQITVQSLKKVYIKLYDKDIQNEIINKLDIVQEIIDIRKKQIEELDELIKSKFVEMFGTLNNSRWKLKKLENVTLKITDGKHGGCEREENSGYYFVGATEIYNNRMNYENANQITKKDFEKDYTRCDLKINDFVIVNTGATIGKSAIIDDGICERVLLQKSVALIRVKKEVILPIFLKYCYECNPSLYSKGQGCARVNLLLSQIKNTMIPVPPIELQNKFASFVKQIDKQKNGIQKSLEEIQKLQESLMNKYFGG